MNWEPVAGFESYLVSDNGSVRPVTPRYKRTINGLRLHRNRDGYPQLSLRSGSKKKTVMLHSIVATAFIGPRPRGKVVNHIDGDKSNCARYNLEYITPSENNRHAFANGLSRRTNTKLSEIDILRIRELCFLGMKNKDIANIYDVSVSTVHLIRHRKRGVIAVDLMTEKKARR